MEAARSLEDLTCDRSGTAVEVDGVEVTWTGLAERVDAQTRQLKAKGVKPGDRVLLESDITLQHVVALLAVLRHGAVVVPLGPDVGAAHLARVRTLTRPAAVVAADGTHAERDRGGQDDIEGWFRGEAAAAYVLFTSGSTGQPKGVVGSRAGLENRLTWSAAAWTSPDVERCGARAHPTFVDSLTEVLGALWAGTTLVLPQPGTTADLQALARFLERGDVHQVTTTPSCLPVLARAGRSRFGALRRWVLSGEPLQPGWLTAARQLAPAAEIINSYGSTEVAGDVAFHRFPLDAPLPTTVPIGHVVDGIPWTMQPAEDDPATGDLLIGGDQVALGYLGATEQEDSAFWDESRADAPAERWFRTGDRVAVCPEGLVHIGRGDDIVKVRGRRVDLRGLERTMGAISGVSEAAAILQPTKDGIHDLDVYVVAEATRLAEGELRRQLEEDPNGATPDRIVIVPSLPRTQSGKLDRRRLLVPDRGLPVPDSTRFHGDLELAVATVVLRVAHVRDLERDTGFQEAGVDSLSLFEISEQLEQLFDSEIGAVEVAQWGTVAAVAQGVLGAVPRTAGGCVRELRRGSPAELLVLFPPALGSGLAFLRLLPHLDVDATVVVVEQTEAVTAAAERGGCAEVGRVVADELLRAHPGARLFVGGWSFGAIVSVHAERWLHREAAEVAGLVLIDPGRATIDVRQPEEWAVRRLLTDFGYDETHGIETTTAAVALVRSRPGPLQGVRAERFDSWVDAMCANLRALEREHTPEPAGPYLGIRGARTRDQLVYPHWFQRGDAPVHDVDATHFELLAEPAVAEVGRLISQWQPR